MTINFSVAKNKPSALLRPACPVGSENRTGVECGAYSSGVSRKKNINFLCVLCVSAVNYYE